MVLIAYNATVLGMLSELNTLPSSHEPVSSVHYYSILLLPRRIDAMFMKKNYSLMRIIRMIGVIEIVTVLNSSFVGNCHLALLKTESSSMMSRKRHLFIPLPFAAKRHFISSASIEPIQRCDINPLPTSVA